MATRKTKKAQAPESAEPLAEVFTHAPVGLFSATSSGEISDANLAFLRLLRHERADVVGRNIIDFIHPDDRQEGERCLELLRSGAQDSGAMEVRCLRADGETVWARLSTKMRRDETHAAVLLIGAVESITDANRRLQEREEDLRRLANRLPQMIWTATPDGMLDYLSDQGLRFLGIDEQNLYGEKWLESVHPDDRDRAVEAWAQALKLLEPYEVSYRLKRFDGTWRWQLVRGLPLKGADGRVTKWNGTCTDIQEQKQAEANLRDQWKTFDTALSYTPDSVYIFDLDGRFTYANEALLKLIEKPASE